MRGGSSKGAYFVAADLPTDDDERDTLLLRIMGSPDERQIDGIGGAHPLTSKVAVVSPSTRDDADVDYLFLQVGVGSSLVSDRQNCGNLLAGVAPFAVERDLIAVDPASTVASIRIRMMNTGSVAVATIELQAGQPEYSGTTAISGVPGTAADIRLDFDDIAGGTTGALLPLGQRWTQSKVSIARSSTTGCLLSSCSPMPSASPVTRAAGNWSRTRHFDRGSRQSGSVQAA